ncbi:hypothetical protein HK097_006229 [Rhizophlyctis rosea]|uniref:GATA-type domain-containing protein n=1 Tax=Rhizophlyctis rosea TaxID=64517 RepID=A0AAD5X5T3_9FUNG|nr:hypothetical protein HK097_006229 [Rhizophlyctis rosea]
MAAIVESATPAASFRPTTYAPDNNPNGEVANGKTAQETSAVPIPFTSTTNFQPIPQLTPDWLDPEELTVAHILQNLKYSSSETSSHSSLGYDDKSIVMMHASDVEEMVTFDSDDNMSESSDDQSAGDLEIDSDVELDMEGEPLDTKTSNTSSVDFQSLPPIMRRPFRATRLKRKVELDSDDEGAEVDGDAAYKPALKRRPSPKKEGYPGLTKHTTPKRMTNTSSADPSPNRVHNNASSKPGSHHRTSSANSDVSSPALSSPSRSPPPTRISAKAKSSSSPPRHRVCNRCFSDETPMWRHGPPEWPDLCNKCGVKYMRGRISPYSDDRSDLVGHEKEPAPAVGQQ